MNYYEVKLSFAYKDDGPSEFDRHGMELTEEDIENRNYNKTFTQHVVVKARTTVEAGARAMIEMQRRGYCEGNYLYLIAIKSRIAKENL